MFSRSALAPAFMMALFLAAGCGSNNPAAPGSGGPGPDADPPIPKPQSALVDAPLQSEVYTVIEPLGTAFGPEVSAVHGTFQVQSRICVVYGSVNCCSSWNVLGNWDNTWSDQLPDVTTTYTGCQGFPDAQLTVSSSFGSLGHRWLVLSDGTLPPPMTLPVTESRPGTPISTDVLSVITFPQMAAKPYLRRDRQWVRENLTDGSASFLLTGSTSADFSTSRTNGIDVTKSRAFAETISGTAGLSTGGITASIEDAVTKSFSTSTTIQQETTTTYTYSVSGTAGKVTVFNVWTLVDTYSLTDKDGNTFADAGYHFAPVDPVVVRGVKHYLDTTNFNQ